MSITITQTKNKTSCHVYIQTIFFFCLALRYIFIYLPHEIIIWSIAKHFLLIKNSFDKHNDLTFSCIDEFLTSLSTKALCIHYHSKDLLLGLFNSLTKCNNNLIFFQLKKQKRKEKKIFIIPLHFSFDIEPITLICKTKKVIFI